MLKVLKEFSNKGNVRPVTEDSTNNKLTANSKPQVSMPRKLHVAHISIYSVPRSALVVYSTTFY